MESDMGTAGNSGKERSGQTIALSIGSTRIGVVEICRRLSIGKLTVYKMLESGEIPAIRIGTRWIVSRFAYENWERTIGEHPILTVRKLGIDTSAPLTPGIVCDTMSKQ